MIRKVITLFLDIFPTGYVTKEFPDRSWEFQLPSIEFKAQEPPYKIKFKFDNPKYHLQISQNGTVLDELITDDYLQVVGWFSWLNSPTGALVGSKKVDPSMEAPASLMSICWNVDSIPALPPYHISLNRFATETHEFIFPRPGKSLQCLAYGPDPVKTLHHIQKITDKVNKVTLQDSNAVRAIMTSLNDIKTITVHPATLKAIIEYFDGTMTQRRTKGYVKHPSKPRQFVEFKADKFLMYQEVKITQTDGFTAHAAIPLSQLQIGP